ncbi:MAG TPA: ATP-dependent DNA helicase RecQ [Tepidisphaeraceae bacterium]|nr:ATP-dependent DNA helicase RecQ [Tepidisphaeraceae bacterium]
MDALQESLEKYFGLSEFRLAQREVIEQVLAGKDVLCVMPTGAGKSLCYQLPAVVQGGLTIVVSPLIALMQDQVQQLKDEGIEAAVINSTLSAAEQRKILQQLDEGFEGLLYVAPERFFSASFQPMLRKLKVKLMAVDEAHCVSQWGHDFRPEYSQLADVRAKLGRPPTIALTATATEDVRADIMHSLDLRDPAVFVTGFDRPNLSYESRSISKVKDKDAELVKLLREEKGGAIVYCSTRKSVDAVAGLVRAGVRDRPIFAYHAGMENVDRSENLEKFMDAPRAIAVATNAFGMGINKPDIRLVVHYNIPGTLEAYYQEAGRAGRDGQPARCVALFSYQDRYTQEFFIDKIGEENGGGDPALLAERKEHARQKLEMMIRYAQSHLCRRQMILDYFGEESQAENCTCDVCRRDKGEIVTATMAPVSEGVTLLVRQLLSGVARLHGKFGVSMVADVMVGAENEKVLRWGFEKLTVFGLLKAYSQKRVVAMLHRLMEAGLAKQKDPEGMKFRPVMELTAAGVAVMKGEQGVPGGLADLLPRGRRESGGGGRGIVVKREDGRVLEVEELSPEAERRFQRLRGARLELAREAKMPPYVICHDRTLKLIAIEAPGDLAGLERVKGMGPTKVKQYGKALLAAIQEETERRVDGDAY